MAGGISQCISYNWNLEHWLLDCVLCIIIIDYHGQQCCCPFCLLSAAQDGENLVLQTENDIPIAVAATVDCRSQKL